jgi:hypothetical protein
METSEEKRPFFLFEHPIAQEGSFNNYNTLGRKETISKGLDSLAPFACVHQGA